MRKGVDCNGVEWEERELSSRMRDRSGETVGFLTILFPVKGVNKNGIARWLCQCKCGNLVVRQSNSLQNGATNSCGCLFKQHISETINKKRLSLIGEKFNKLTVVDIAYTEESQGDSGHAYYKCMCDCGNPKSVIARGTDLKLGKYASCGCSKAENEMKKRTDLTGMRFGKLTVKGFAYIKDDAAYWSCICDCGNLVNVKGAYLNFGNVSSCGCLNSIGELNIIQILNDNNIKYLHNKEYFKDLLSVKNHILRYDFILLENNKPFRLIEFDGPQHNNPNDYFGGKEAYETLVYHDMLKNKYALSHNIPLIRIPYSKRDTMCLEDILGNKYLIKGDN